MYIQCYVHVAIHMHTCMYMYIHVHNLQYAVPVGAVLDSADAGAISDISSALAELKQ